MSRCRIVLALLAACIAWPASAAPSDAAPKGFADPLDVPAQMSPLAARTLLVGVARAGERIVAVGPRGHIVVSADHGATWKQSPVPVSSDLTAVHFVDARNGWAVGHDGVVLATADGGDTWTLQLDGKRANDLIVKQMEARVAAQPGDAALARLHDDAKRYQEQGPDKPFLDVWFADRENGYVVGAYNLIFRTADGGKTWQPWFDRTDNPKAFNLYAIRPAAGGVYIAGEAGLLLKLDDAAQRFRALESPYKGSFFGLADGKDGVVAFGLRGNALRSDDGGRTWAKVDPGLRATIASGTRNGNGDIVLADVTGRVAISRDGGRTYQPAAASAVPITGIADAGGNRYALVGPRGASVADIAPR